MVWMGIDPGKKGGVSFVDNKGMLVSIAMPEDLDLSRLCSKTQIKHCYLEKAHAMPGQGVTSMFTYGVSYGVIQGILIANRIPYTLVKPQGWQKMMFKGTAQKSGNVKRNPKDRALEAANRIFCKTAKDWLATARSKKPHDGMIDSALIAECCRREIS